MIKNVGLRQTINAIPHPKTEFNFLGSDLDSRITFARNSIGTYFDSAGVMQTAIADAPRFDHDPVTLAPLGILIEPSRKNYLLNSATLSTQNVTVTAAAFTLSFWGTGSIALSGTSSGTLSGTGASDRVSLTFTPTAGTLTLTVTGSVTNAQLELGSPLTSYIPTTGSQVTRSSDDLLVSGTNFSSWYNQTEGVIAIRGKHRQCTTNVEMAFFFDGTADNTHDLYVAANSATLKVFTNKASVTQVNGTMSSVFVSDTYGKMAYGYQANNSIWAGNGELGTIDSSCSMPTVDRMNIGCANNGSHWNGHIQYLKYWDKRLPNGVLQQISK